jgi:formylglycine-generating enzyme required for sulfatase activity
LPYAIFLAGALIFAGNPWSALPHTLGTAGTPSPQLPGGRPAQFNNSIHMKMIRVNPGSFDMGAINTHFQLGKKTDYSKDAPFYDELPVHHVTITYPFYISETEVTAEQFRRFKKDYKGSEYFAPYATGVSWNEAMAFCAWLSKKEKKTYRLPTEAEWEYAGRAGTQTLFWSGDHVPANDVNPWGIKNMASGVAEWCYDWHGLYPDSAQTDPVGYDGGWAKVIRGGAANTSELEGRSPDFHPDTSAVYYRACNRSSMQPDCPAAGSDQPRPHFVGFRIVQAELPKTAPLRAFNSFPLEGVKQSTVQYASAGPDANTPYFKARVVMASPPDLTMPFENKIVGLDPANQGKVHSSGFVACPNGDILLVGFSSSRTKSESATNATMVVTRLRSGAEEWELPEVFYDRSGLNDQSALLWNDNGKLWFFGGGRGLGNVPFVFTTSTDNGATWSPLTTPAIKGSVAPFAPQPITSAFRGPDGTIYFGSDAIGSSSFLWASKDNGKTWYDTQGRTFGRHTTFVLLKDNRILAMGGKNSNVEGYMPKSYSSDFGKTWSAKEKTPFASLGSNQRPVILRLKSGRLFFAGDYQDIKMMDIPPPKDITDRGSYVALSDDEGATWKIKKLAMAPAHNDWRGIVKKGKKPQHGFGTLGYCAVTQAPNGIIHLMTSKGRPSMHFAMNEAWILSDYTGEVNELPGKPDASKLKTITEKYPDGQVRITSSGWIGKTGFVLHGTENWFYENGKKQYEATFNNGALQGMETYRNCDGSIKWTRDHTPYGTTVYTTYWPNGKKKTQSTWWGLMAHGPAASWDKNGKLLHEVLFENGKIVNQPSQTGQAAD